MLELLRDPAWQFAGIIIGTLVAVGIYLAQRSRRELSFGVLSARALLTVHDSLSSRVRVTLDGKPVSDANLIVFALKNSGNVPIRPADFQRPLAFCFARSAHLLSVEIAKRSPPNLDASISVDATTTLLSPMLLNPGEYLVLQALVAGRDQSVTCDARLEGISSVKQLRRSAPQGRGIHQRIGAVVLGLPFRAAFFWFVLSTADALLDLKLLNLFTVNGSLAFGIIAAALFTSVLEEFTDALKAILRVRSTRTVDDA